MKKNFTLKPLICALAASVLLLPAAGCNSSGDTPADVNQPGITDTADKPTTAPDATATPTPDATTPDVPVTSAPDADATDIPDEVSASVPQFSAEGGFYDKQFSLTLSSEPGTTVYYTLDGSDPRTSDTAIEYTTEILIYDNTDEPNVYSALKDITLGDYTPPQFNIDKGITVRAVIKTAEGEFGTVVANSYFVGKDASYYSEMKVISLVTDSDYLFDKKTGAYMIGSKYAEWLSSDEYIPYDAGDVRNVTNYNTKGRESEFPVSVQVFEEGKAVYSADVGARISGNWSRSHAQKSIRLYSRKEYGTKKMKYSLIENLTDADGNLIESFDKVTIRNGGNDFQELHFRDALIHDLSKDLAFDVMGAEPCVMFINGEFWGFYMIREKTDGEYIESHYGIPKEDVAVIKNSDVEEGTEEDLEEFRNFCLWAASADMTDEANYKKLCDSMDIQSLMDYVTVETYINNNDWANGSSNNWMVWHSRTVNPDLPKADGKWRFILYDTEFSTGIYGNEKTRCSYDLLNKMSAGDEDFNIPNIVRSLCKNDEFRQKFHDNYLHIMETCFNSDLVNQKTDEYAAAYREAVLDTFYRFGMDWAAYNFDNEVEQFKYYFERRPKYATQYLDTFCGVQKAETNTNTDTTSFSENQIPETSAWTYNGDATFRADSTDNSFHVSVPQATENSWRVQALAGDIELIPGGEYRLTFDASSSDSAKPKLLFALQEGWSEPQAWVAEIPLTPDLKSYEFRFVMKEWISEGWKFCLNVGKCTGDLVFKNVSLTRVR